jgi:hypothetical protein
MQSYNDLNNYSATPVNYATSADYAITFGANQGNLSTTEFEGGYFLIYKRVPLTVFSDVSKDLLVTISTSTVGKVIAPVYFGTNTNVKIWQSTPQSWTITGIRTVANYDDVFANTYLGLASGSTGTADIVFLIDDQISTTRTYTATVTIVPNTLFSFTPTIAFAEDTLASFGNLTITDSVPQTTDYTVNLTPIDSALGKIKVVGGALSNTYSFTGTKTAVNNSLANVRFAPGADSRTNTQVNVLVTRTFDSKTVGQVVNANWNSVGHSNYSVPNSWNGAEDQAIELNNISITDIRPDNIDANTQYLINLATSDVANSYLVYQGSNVSSVNISGTKSQVNTILGSANTRPKLQTINDFYGQTSVTFSQTNTTDNVIQADQLSIPVFVTDSVEYALNTNYYTPNTEDPQPSTRFTYEIFDQDVQANVYTMTFQQTTGNTGNFYVNGVDVGSGPVVFANSRANVNTSNVSWTTSKANIGNATFDWSLVKTRTTGANIVIANAEVINFTTSVTNLGNNYAYTSNTVTSIFANVSTRPQLNANIVGSVTLELSTNSGYFGTVVQGTDASNVFVFTGTVASVNSTLAAMRFWPNYGVSNVVSANIRATSGVNTILNRVLFFEGTSAPVPNTLLTSRSYSTTGTFTPILAETLYTKYDIMMIGGGGGAGGTTNYAGSPWGLWGIGKPGGGAGGVYYEENRIVPYLSTGYFASVGGGGGTGPTINDPNNTVTSFVSNGSPGGNTVLIGGNINLTVAGGNPGTGSGTRSPDPAGYTLNWTAGSSAPGNINGTTYAGYAGGAYETVDSRHNGGGGGGAGGPGGNGVGGTNGGGAGGAGWVGNISGANVTYAIGGIGPRSTGQYTSGQYGSGGYFGTTGNRGRIIIKNKPR